MRPNIEHKFNSPEQELEWLRSRYKEESVRSQKGRENDRRTRVGNKVLYEHIQKDPEKALGDNYRLPVKERESLVAKF